jgi:predicted Zn-dependent protease
MRTGRKHEALKELEVLLTKDPDKILIKGYLVDLYYNIGNLGKCRLYLNDILNTTPSNSHNYNAARQRFIHHFGYDPTKK